MSEAHHMLKSVTFLCGLLASSATPRTQLLIDPDLVASRTGSVQPALSNVTKEPRSPVLIMDKPWETQLDYAYVVWAEEIERLVMYYGTVMCTSYPQQHRPVYVCDDKQNPPMSATLRAESVDGVVWSKPPIHTLSYNGTSANNALQLNQTRGISDSRGIFRDPLDPNPNQLYKLAGRFFRSTATGPLAQWPGYHFGTASSPDGVHWHGLTDISEQLQARADTSNTVVYDEVSKEWMIFTRVDCHYPPFNDNPSLANCSQPGWGGQGLRRSARSVSKTWGNNATWSTAQQCSHGTTGNEQYTLSPWRDKSWRPGLWLGLASFYQLSTGSVQSELVVSPDHGASWSRVSPNTPFIPHGNRSSFDSTGIYAASPVPDPFRPDRLLIYYEGANVPHDQTPGHSAYGLAYSPTIPVGMGGVGSLITKEIEVGAGGDQFWVVGDAVALDRLILVARSSATLHSLPRVWRAMWFSSDDGDVERRTSNPVKRTILEWCSVHADQVLTENLEWCPVHVDQVRMKNDQWRSSKSLSELVGPLASFEFLLQAGSGIIHSFGFGPAAQAATKYEFSDEIFV